MGRFYVAHPASEIARGQREITAAYRLVHLISCARPKGILEPAPATSLGEAVEGEQWDGFWCDDDERFYARCVAAAGTERWFRIGDVAETARAAGRPARVLAFRAPSPNAPRMIVGRYRGQAMLVGTRARRRPVEAR